MTWEPAKHDFTDREKELLRSAGYDPAEVYSFEHYLAPSGKRVMLVTPRRVMANPIPKGGKS
jgi:hypothetical protein